MRKLIIIGLISLFATCNKSASLTIDLSHSYAGAGKKIVAAHTWMVYGPGPLTFNNTQDSLKVTITGTKFGNYKIGHWVKDNNNLVDTGYTYVNAHK